MDLIDQIQCREQWRAVVKTVMNHKYWEILEWLSNWPVVPDVRRCAALVGWDRVPSYCALKWANLTVTYGALMK
jgi:hypothetical protein